MPSAITTKPIVFDNNRKAFAVFPPPDASAEEIAAALQITPPQAVLLVIGGADNLDAKVNSRLIQLFGRGVARAVADMQALSVDGGTEAGVMKMMGQGVADRGFKSSLIGVAPVGLISYPGSEGDRSTPLDPNHSHFVLVEGNNWGDETGVIFKLMDWFRQQTRVMVLLAGGGEISRHEVLQTVRQNLPLIVIEGSSGVADEIAAAWKAKPDLPDDPVLAEIIADGRIELYPLSNSVKGAERLLVRELGGDNVLRQAWQRFADYDFNAIQQQGRFYRIQWWILAIGLLAAALALAKQVFGPAQPAFWSLWGFIKYVLIILPIGLAVMITAYNRFKQGNKWLLLRQGAESIKREIYRYRARAGAYQIRSASSPSEPAAPPPPPPPTREQVLAERVEDITRRVMRTEVNSTSVVPYTKDLPPKFAAAPGDDGFSVLSPDRYLQDRLDDQRKYYRRKAVVHDQTLKRTNLWIFIIGGAGTLLAAIDLQVWIALTTAVAAAFTTYLSYKQTENTLMKYNQAATDLDSVKAWWTALPPDDQAKQENLNTLVDHTEMVLQTEHDGWIQQMQNALAELRKDQERAPVQGPLTGGSGGPSADAAKAGAATRATDAGVPTDAETTDPETETALTEEEPKGGAPENGTSEESGEGNSSESEEIPEPKTTEDPSPRK